VILGELAVLKLCPASNPSVPRWELACSLATIGMGMGLIQSPTAATVTYVVEQAKPGVATGIFHTLRFVSGSLGSTVFGLVLQTNATGVAPGFQFDLSLPLALSTLAMLIAQGLPTRAARLADPVDS
jgi:hypothetical protein